MVLTYEEHRTSPGFSDGENRRLEEERRDQGRYSQRVDAMKNEKHMNSDHANQTPVHAVHAQRHIYPGQTITKDYRQDRENIVHREDGTTYTYYG